MDDTTPVPERLIGRADSLNGSVEHLWTLKDEFQDLAAGAYFTTWVNSHLAEMRNEATPAGLWFWPDFCVHRGQSWSLRIRVYDEQTPLQSSAEAAIYAPIGPQSLHCRQFRLPPHRNEVFDPAIELEPAGSVTLNPGETLLAAPDLVHDFKSPAVAAVLSVPVATTLRWTFDRATRKALRATDAVITDMQLRAAADVLGQLRDPSSLEVLEGLSHHRHHGVRWSAIQNLGRIKANAARPALERALDDPHPHVQAAAAKTLRQLNPGT